jgi:hypothetical protein
MIGGINPFFSLFFKIGYGRRFNSFFLYTLKKNESFSSFVYLLENKDTGTFFSYSYIWFSFYFLSFFGRRRRRQKENMYCLIEYIDLEEDLEGGSHGRFEVDHSDVLPVLLQQRSEEVGSQLGVKSNLALVHAHMSHSHVHGDNLLELELDSRSDLRHLREEIISVSHNGREFTGLGEGGS